MIEPRQKYGNKRCNASVDGQDIVFASKWELERYNYLLWLEKAGEIQTIHLQPEYELEPAFVRNGKKYQREYYRADFSYVKGGKIIAEDTKGGKVTALYRSKMKRFLAKYPDIVFVEVYKNYPKGWLEREY